MPNLSFQIDDQHIKRARGVGSYSGKPAMYEQEEVDRLSLGLAGEA